MPISQALTRKGNLRVREILDATVRCLARDGYAATSIQRVADEAGLHKRVVLYYCGSREGLFDAVVRDLGDRLFDPLGRALAELEDPKDIVERGYDMIWAAITTDRALLVAWFGLRAEAITNPVLAATANYISDRFRALISRLIDRMLSLLPRLLHGAAELPAVEPLTDVEAPDTGHDAAPSRWRSCPGSKKGVGTTLAP